MPWPKIDFLCNSIVDDGLLPVYFTIFIFNRATIDIIDPRGSGWRPCRRSHKPMFPVRYRSTLRHHPAMWDSRSMVVQRGTIRFHGVRVSSSRVLCSRRGRGEGLINALQSFFPQDLAILWRARIVRTKLILSQISTRTLRAWRVSLARVWFASTPQSADRNPYGWTSWMRE